jgi:type IV pilus assembly protein PilN
MRALAPAAINLASQPFRRERAQLAGLASVCALLVCGLLMLGGLILHERADAGGLRRQIAKETATLKSLQTAQGRFSAVLGKPENADTFATSVFLNELIARRGVSWTRVFRDLETVMPDNMRLMAIRLPQTGPGDANGANRVQLDMQVGTTQPEAVITLLKRLQQSSLFGAAAMMNQSPPTQNDPLYKYRVTVEYAQKL